MTVANQPLKKSFDWKRLFRRPEKPYWHPYLGGFLLGLLLFASFFLTGNGLGASGGLNRFVVAVQDQIAPRHVDTNPYLLRMAGGDKNPLDDWVVMVVIGAFLGGFVSGWVNGRLKIETNKGPQISTRTRWLMAFLGGLIMVYGARMARGCTSGLALSGGAVLSVGAWAFMFSIFASAYALAYFVRKLWL
ncbi:MAG: YeeE/YedE family protein [Anaerolineales bacterium]|nr:YeeE/YedE family protein [Anaerolineales bacterium]MCX7609164.1 YeeE/YedE family protein [Anaerolineales bacterium]